MPCALKHNSVFLEQKTRTVLPQSIIKQNKLKISRTDKNNSSARKEWERIQDGAELQDLSSLEEAL